MVTPHVGITVQGFLWILWTCKGLKHSSGTDLGGGIFLLIIIHIIHCYTQYFNLQAGVKIVIITIVKIITFITCTCTHAN